MQKILLSLSMFLIAAQFSRANDSSYVRLQFKPDRIECAPFQASMTEPQFGLSKEFAARTMKINLGNAVDLMRISVNEKRKDAISYSAGIDFFTYARITGWEGLRLQVDAVDGLFGGHISIVKPVNKNELQLRIRFLHLSAHYVDGHFDNISQEWKDGREPVPFTRDFADLCLAYRLGGARFYALLEQAFRIRPFNQRRTWYEAGGEWFFGHFDDPTLHPYFAQDIRFVAIESYHPNYVSMLGIKWGEMYGSGFNLFLRYYSGVGPFSEYLDQRINEWSFGFSIDYW